MAGLDFSNYNSGYTGPYDLTQHTNDLGYNANSQLAPLLQGQIQDAIQGQDRVRGARQQASNLATPEGRAMSTQAFGNRQMSAARMQGRRIGAMLRAQGLGPESANGAMLDAQNRATDSTNDYAINAESPAEIEKLLQTQIDLNDPKSIISALPLIMQLEQLRRSQEDSRHNHKSKGGGFLGSLLGTVAGGLDWTKLLGGLV